MLFQAIMTMVGRVTPLLLHTANPVVRLIVYYIFSRRRRCVYHYACAVGLTKRSLTSAPPFINYPPKSTFSAMPTIVS